MRAGVALPDGLQTVAHEFARERGVFEHVAHFLLHVGAVVRDEEIAARREQVFAVRPRSADERNAARERFENTDGGNAGQRFGVRSARNVHGHAIARRRHPARASSGDNRDSRCRPRRAVAGVLRIAHAVQARGKMQRADRFDQEFLQLARAFAIAPVADPDQIAARRYIRLRMEYARIGRFVPRPCARAPAFVEIALAHRFAERETPSTSRKSNRAISCGAVTQR